MRGIKFIGTPPSWLPFLVYEYGLGELSPYVPTLHQLIAEGIEWQRIRGTPGAIEKGLSWIDYGSTLEEAPVRRTRWHLFMLELDRVRDNEEPDLDRIEGITQLSVPLRSHFWRGYKTYDARALEWGWTRWGNTLWADYSGKRIADGHAKWSFGRNYALETTLDHETLEALEAWIPELPAEEPNIWRPVEWPPLPWVRIDAQTRRQSIINLVYAHTAWITFLDADDEVIGHRKARAWHRVRSAGQNAAYNVNGITVEPTTGTDASALYVEAMTDFSDGYGAIAAKWQVRLGASLADPSRPGLLWAEPGELTGGTVVAEKTDAIEFGRTVRERCRALLRVV